MFISLVPRNNLLGSLNRTEEPLSSTTLLVECWIEPEWFPTFWLSPGYLFDWDITPDLSLPAVLMGLLGVVGRACGYDPGQKKLSDWRMRLKKGWQERAR